MVGLGVVCWNEEGEVEAGGVHWTGDVEAGAVD